VVTAALLLVPCRWLLYLRESALDELQAKTLASGAG
jgi:hypothetical protein